MMRIQVDAESPHPEDLEPLIAVLSALVGDAMMARLHLEAAVDRRGTDDIVVTITPRPPLPIRTLDIPHL